MTTSFVRKRKKTDSGPHPLYVVSKDGKDVEKADSFFDLWIKKMGLAPTLKLFQDIINGLVASLLSMVTNYHTFKMVKDYLDDILNQVILVLSPIEAVLNGHRNRRL